MAFRYSAHLLREDLPAADMEHRMRTTRRTFVRASLATAAAALLPISPHAQQTLPAQRPIPSTREEIPIVGLGTWITFNVGDDRMLRDECAGVMAAFFEAGGRMIDLPHVWLVAARNRLRPQSSGDPPRYSRPKVWTSSAAEVRPDRATRRFWGCRSSTSSRFTTCSPEGAPADALPDEGGRHGALR